MMTADDKQHSHATRPVQASHKCVVGSIIRKSATDRIRHPDHFLSGNATAGFRDGVGEPFETECDID